jgi:hypothetical protein
MKDFVTRLQPFTMITFQYLNMLIKVCNERKFYSKFKNDFLLSNMPYHAFLGQKCNNKKVHKVVGIKNILDN